ncbi:maturation protein [ssRNA phage Zoerhiza.1_9]|uniref:Maturation protein n=2 Tax=Norzivirales TaxID=2842247 RepID=A0A8S5KX99_9VIRU|nr:maturation protein [ssRNA phage Zoerhiza.1_9]QDH86944.1 MAG: hypothetical protein H1Rhizo25610_000001 [Leviviridae sp.]DAD50062.1 TPA_asm: maturation protein [ssRNA phage Zoerhiza.1_9]
MTFSIVPFGPRRRDPLDEVYVQKHKRRVPGSRSKANRNYDRSEYVSNYFGDRGVFSNDTTGSIAIDEKRSNQPLSYRMKRNYGDNLPDWKVRIIQGQNATTSADNHKGSVLKHGSYEFLFETLNPPPFRTRTFFYGHYLNPYPVASSLVDSSLDNLAKTKFIRYAKKAQATIKGGEFLHDLSKSIRSFGRVRSILLHSLFGHVDQVKKQILGVTRERSTRKVVKQLSENWLEYSYGISPTISDLQDIGFGLWRAYDQAHNGRDNKHITGHAESWSSSVTESTIAALSSQSHSSSTVVVGVKQISTIHNFVKYTGSARLLRENMAATIPGQLGLTFRDFVPTLWEIIPYSFVVDYFTNFGQIIDAWSFPRSDILWVSRTWRNHILCRVEYYPFIKNSTGITINAFHSMPGEYTHCYFGREIYSGSLVPSFRWHLPYRETDWVGLLALIGAKLK